MGARGPAKKPEGLRVLEGKTGKQKPKLNTPRPRPLAPVPPDWLDTPAVELWNELAPKLEPLGLLTEVDLMNFTNLCIAGATVRKMREYIRDNGEVMEIGPQGYRQQCPEVSIMNKNIELVAKLSAKFGLSPADRVGLNLGKKENDDSFEEFLKRGKG